ncbi:MAG: MFS transporter [Desulfobacterales bacterium]
MNRYSQTTNFKAIFAITLVHFLGDFYGSFTTPLFPAFVEKLGLSLTQVGIIAGMNRFMAFIVQPSVGYMADRYETRTFILGGLLLSIVFIPLTGIAPSFWVLFFCVALGSIGSSMFHPSVAGMVPLYAGQKVGLSMSIFNTGGTFAFAVGPIFITTYVAAFGLEAVPATMAIGLAVMIYLFYKAPVPQSEGLKHLGFFGALKEALGSVWKSILLIWIVMVIRAIVGQSFLTFIPVLYVQQGYSLTSAGILFAFLTVTGTLSGILAGYFADKIGYKPIFFLTHALMTPVLILFLYLTGGWVYLGAALAGFFVMATLPLGVAMAQELAPQGRSMVASLMMGLAFGMGGVVSPLVGKLADLFTIHTILIWVSFVPLATLVPIYFFPEIKRPDLNS